MNIFKDEIAILANSSNDTSVDYFQGQKDMLLKATKSIGKSKDFNSTNSESDDKNWLNTSFSEKV